MPRLRSQLPTVSSIMKLHLEQQGDCSHVNEKHIVYKYYLESGKGLSVNIASKLLLLSMHLKMHSTGYFFSAWAETKI